MDAQRQTPGAHRNSRLAFRRECSRVSPHVQTTTYKIRFSASPQTMRAAMLAWLKLSKERFLHSRPASTCLAASDISSIKQLKNQSKTLSQSSDSDSEQTRDPPAGMERILHTFHVETVAKSTVNKIRALCKSIEKSPQQQQKFESIMALNPSLVFLKATTLVLDVCTRWNSTHKMLQRALDFRTVIVVYVQYEKYPQDRRISDVEWAACEQVIHILQ